MPRTAMSGLPRRFARYGPEDRYFSPPAAGLCISAFAILRRGSKILVGKPALDERWSAEWFPNFVAYGKAELAEFSENLQVPCTYLFEGEHPDDALKRVMRDQLGARDFEAAKPVVFSYTAPSDRYPGNRHWDLGFVYKVRSDLPRTPSAHWRELRWRDARELRSDDFGWNGDLLVDLGVLKR